MQDYKTQHILNIVEKINSKVADNNNDNHNSRMESESVITDAGSRKPRMSMIIKQHMKSNMMQKAIGFMTEKRNNTMFPKANSRQDLTRQ